MNNTQKIIKYAALAFAFYLIFNIVSGIIFGTSILVNVFDNKETKSELNDISIKNNSTILNIELYATNLEIVEGDQFKVQTNNKYIIVNQDENKLIITESKRTRISNKNNDLIIYIPRDTILETATISIDAGKLTINKISANKMTFVLGAGNTKINELNVYEKADILGGVGKLEINSGIIHNLDLNIGIGKTDITSRLIGKNDIETGIGEVNINLAGNENDYKINVEKGIGSITIDGENAKNDTTYGYGNNIIDIEGGIGSVNINY